MTKLTRTMSSSLYPKKWTFSTWLKRGNMNDEYYILYAVDGGATNKTHVTIVAGTGVMRIYNTLSSSTSNNLITRRAFRDPSAWYHIVVIWDTANVTTGDRIRLYINGVRETDFTTETLNDENGTINTAVEHQISGYNSTSPILGVMAHTHFCDNQTYDASYFGETDSTTGVWVPNTSPSVTYGTNGFFLKYAAGAHGTDSSGESNDFTVGGTATNTKDTPHNNFATMNPLINYYQGSPSFTNGNTTVTTVASKYAPTYCTIGLETGKWYWEVKPTARAGANDYLIGISSTQTYGDSYELGNYANDWAYASNTGNYRNDDGNTSYGDSYDTNDVIGVALDLTNMNLYFSKNGVWQNSGVPTSGATGTGAIDITTKAMSATSIPLGAYFPALTYEASAAATLNMNFGNGYFGTTSHGETNADDAGNGLFKYDVPAGFYAICTDNITTYG